MADAEIDYIDLESLKVAESDAQWTIPRGQGGVVQMEEFKANLGQPIYIQECSSDVSSRQRIQRS